MRKFLGSMMIGFGFLTMLAAPSLANACTAAMVDKDPKLQIAAVDEQASPHVKAMIGKFEGVDWGMGKDYCSITYVSPIAGATDKVLITYVDNRSVNTAIVTIKDGGADKVTIGSSQMGFWARKDGKLDVRYYGRGGLIDKVATPVPTTLAGTDKTN